MLGYDFEYSRSDAGEVGEIPRYPPNHCATEAASKSSRNFWSMSGGGSGISCAREELMVSRRPWASGRSFTVIPFGIHFFSVFDHCFSLGSHSSPALTEYTSDSFFNRLVLRMQQPKLGGTRREEGKSVRQRCEGLVRAEVIVGIQVFVIS